MDVVPLTKGGKRLGTGNSMLFGSAIFIFTLYFYFILQCLSHFFVCFMCYRKTRTFEYAMSTREQILLWASGFSRFLTSSVNYYYTFPCSTWDALATRSTTFPILILFKPQSTAARTCPSWTRACWYSLIFYVLCCRTCHNTTVIFTMCFTFVGLITLFLIKPSPLLDGDLLFVKWAMKSPFDNWFKSSNMNFFSPLSRSSHYL